MLTRESQPGIPNQGTGTKEQETEITGLEKEELSVNNWYHNYLG